MYSKKNKAIGKKIVDEPKPANVPIITEKSAANQNNSPAILIDLLPSLKFLYQKKIKVFNMQRILTKYNGY